MLPSMNFNNLRKEYYKSSLSKNAINNNPFEQFQHWIKQAIKPSVIFQT